MRMQMILPCRIWREIASIREEPAQGHGNASGVSPEMEIETQRGKDHDGYLPSLRHGGVT